MTTVYDRMVGAGLATSAEFGCRAPLLGRHRITTGELAIGPVVGVGTVSRG